MKLEKIAISDHPVHSLIVERFSPYVFADRSVSEEDLACLFEAARWAPSSYNEQPWRYVVARREEAEEFARLLSCLVEANQAWARFASALAIGICIKTFARNGKPNRAAEHDLGLAAGNLCLEATARGIRVHQMIGILPDRAREQFALPPEAEALTALAIGHAGENAAAPDALRERDRAPRQRKPLAEFVFSGRWGTAAALGR
jgi:nitroreductase